MNIEKIDSFIEINYNSMKEMAKITGINVINKENYRKAFYTLIFGICVEFKDNKNFEKELFNLICNFMDKNDKEVLNKILNSK